MKNNINIECVRGQYRVTKASVHHRGCLVILSSGAFNTLWCTDSIPGRHICRALYAATPVVSITTLIVISNIHQVPDPIESECLPMSKAVASNTVSWLPFSGFLA